MSSSPPPRRTDCSRGRRSRPRRSRSSRSPSRRRGTPAPVEVEPEPEVVEPEVPSSRRSATARQGPRRVSGASVRSVRSRTRDRRRDVGRPRGGADPRRRRRRPHHRGARRAAHPGQGRRASRARRAARRAEGRAEASGSTATGRCAFEPGQPNVWLFVGVNGVGKTTTIGKVGKQQRRRATVVLAAGDTFRAAAAEQLGTWAERAGADFVRGAEGADPARSIFDAVQRAGRPRHDLVLADTAGRLHTKSNLMEELRRSVGSPTASRATSPRCCSCSTPPPARTGSCRRGSSPRPSTSPASCSPSSTARPRAASCSPSSHELGIPVKLVGLGEGADDLVAFDPDEFVEALFE